LIDFSSKLIEWQRRHGRHSLPWQNTQDPYRVWLSEIMLQQTQVSTVLGYYDKFLSRFADVNSLAGAPLDDVLALWSGLGYYSRARNLHRCAQMVVAQHGGEFPRSSAELAQLPGIGRSTAAAIAAFCFGERVAILDGNVKRVLTRLLAFEGDLALGAQERLLWERATELLPHNNIQAYTQGLMDLGATLCTTRAPSCLLCPAQTLCRAAQAQTQTRYPIKTRKLKRSQRSHAWLLLQKQQQIWLVQRPDKGVWAGLWSLPEFETPAALTAESQQWPGQGEWLPSFTHTLTHLDWTLQPMRWVLPGHTPSTAFERLWPTGRWFDVPQALASGLPAPLRKLLEVVS
jgi:A/G-specific adenine glycosylase